MTRREFPGAWYIDALPSGEFCAIAVSGDSDGKVLHTHLGNVKTKVNPIYLRTLKDKFAAIGGSDDFSYEFIYSDLLNPIKHIQSCGTNSLIYDKTLQLIIAECKSPTYSLGYRYRDYDTGELVLGASTYASPEMGLWEWTYLGNDIYIGQGSPSGSCVYDKSTKKRGALYIDDEARTIRANRDGELVTISYWQTNNKPAVIINTTMTELREIANKITEPIPMPIPINVPAWPRKMWVSSYFSYSLRPGMGDTMDPFGNAITLVGTEDSGEMIVDEVKKYQQLGQPMFVAADKGNPINNLNLTIAWLAGGNSIESLEESVNKILLLPEKPIIAYLDNRDWPVERPTFISGKVWPSVQCYRNAGESVAAFSDKITDVCERVENYGRPFFLTLRMDNSNGQFTEEQVLELMPVYDQLTREFNVVGLMLFSDRRGFGMARIPSLRNWGKAFANAAERPSRYDYWSSGSVDADFVLKEKLRQSTHNIVLTQEEKTRLLGLLGSSPVPIPVPIPTPPSNQIPSEDEVLNAIRTVKSNMENSGDAFRSKSEVESDYNNQDNPEAVERYKSDKQRAMRCTIQTCRLLNRTYPNVGLEFYGGASGEPAPGLLETYSFDIILLSHEGPSVDILGAAVDPQFILGDNTPENIANWTRDWRSSK